MPQLDALTYFSQYVYLLISFVGSYMLVTTFIIPNLVALLKLRQKLNSLGSLTTSLGGTLAGTVEAHGLNDCAERLALECWYDGVQKGSRRVWSYAGSLIQLTACVRLKKLLVKNLLLPYRI